jgi:hypothetical protein
MNFSSLGQKFKLIQNIVKIWIIEFQINEVFLYLDKYLSQN